VDDQTDVSNKQLGIGGGNMSKNKKKRKRRNPAKWVIWFLIGSLLLGSLGIGFGILFN
jgi:hypothetical protein